MDTTNEDGRLAKARSDLAYMRIRFKGRRPAAETLLNEFDTVLDDAEGEVRDILARAERDIRNNYQGRLQHAEDRAKDAVNRYVEKRSQVVDLQNQLQGMRSMKELRARDGDNVRVAFERSEGFDWTLADIEEIAYRMRMGGAEDDTVVNTSLREISTWVPDPNMVRLALKDQTPEPKKKPFWWWPKVRMVAYVFGPSIAILGAMIMGSR